MPFRLSMAPPRGSWVVLLVFVDTMVLVLDVKELQISLGGPRLNLLTG